MFPVRERTPVGFDWPHAQQRLNGPSSVFVESMSGEIVHLPDPQASSPIIQEAKLSLG